MLKPHCILKYKNHNKKIEKNTTLFVHTDKNLKSNSIIFNYKKNELAIKHR